LNYQFNVENDKRKSASKYYENENKFEKVKVFKSTVEQVYAVKNLLEQLFIQSR
jgi:hypothetical protein